VPRALCLLAALVLFVALAVGPASGERSQRGTLIVSLDGRLSPLQLPRDHAAPIAVHLEGGLETDDGSLLPRVTRLELGLPGQGVLSTRGLPVCSPRQLRNATPRGAREACGPALVGEGSLRADVRVPDQPSFPIQARLLAFNARIGGRRAVLLYAFAPKPPTVVVLPFLLRRDSGRFGLALVADLPRNLGPWPHLAEFAMTLSRRYSYRGERRSYLSASCPVSPRATAGFFSLAKASFTLVGGRRISTGITRGCRAR
jgi:hypothetical protein